MCLVDRYLDMKERVIASGFAREIDWQNTRSLERLTEDELLAEGAWVILCSGMRETVVKQRYGAISQAFLHWVSADAIATRRIKCEEQAFRVFKHRGKIGAIGSFCEKVSRYGFDQVLQRIERSGVTFLQSFDFIGPVTGLHLAKNIGLDVVKPDRHLVRMANAFHSSPEGMCKAIAEVTGDRLSAIDLVLWRYATLDPNYLDLFDPNSPDE
jgi:hypothetical protein